MIVAIINAMAAKLAADFASMAVSGPGTTMYYRDVKESTNFGRLLHKEGLWSLYQFAEDRSIMYHLCRGYMGFKQENLPVNPDDGRCFGCGLEAPDEIRGLWTLHNFDWVQGQS